MTHRRLVKLDDFVKEPTTYNRFGEKVTKTPIERIANGGLLSNYKQLSTNAKYIKFTGMLEPNDGGEGMYIQDDTITNDEDIGVIIYIGEHKYRRLYAAWVNIDWFYLGDFGQALQRACNYNSIRGTAGKTYECKTEISIYIDINSIDLHGMVDFNHKLIDMRGATVNFTNEEALYCFNIRIYHRDTKFMFTNCNFNVTDNNIGLVNIANIIGVNSYTDMLTGNIYNVSKDKLPDTNSVVLTDAPEIDGIKTFDTTGQLNYIGEALSANDNQAVTKEYKLADCDETAYVSLKDTRKLAGLTIFKDIFDRDQGNIVLTGNINNAILDAIQSKLQALLITNITSVWVPRTYILYNNSSNAITQNYINIGIPIYKIYASDLTIIIQQQHIVDESDLSEPLFTKVMFSAPIKFKPIIVEEEDIIGIEDRTIDGRFVNTTLQIDARCYIVTTDITVTIDDVPMQVTTAYVTEDFMPVFIFSVGDLWYSAFISRMNQAWDIVTVDNMGVQTLHHITGFYNEQPITLSTVGYPYSIQFRSLNVNTICVNKYIDNITYTNKAIRKVTNFPIEIQSTTIVNTEYLASILPSFYLPDEIVIDEEGYVSVEYMYLKFLVPIQANLVQFGTDTKPTSLVSIMCVYNNIVISTNTLQVFIARFISFNIPRYELPINYTKNLSTVGDSIRYPIYSIYTNNGTLPKTITLNPFIVFGDPSIDIASLQRDSWCDEKNSSCRCSCKPIYGDIAPDRQTRTAVTMHVHNTTKSYHYHYQVYIGGCGSGGQNYDNTMLTGGMSHLYIYIQSNSIFPPIPTEYTESISMPAYTFTINPGEVKILYNFIRHHINKATYRTGFTTSHIRVGGGGWCAELGHTIDRWVTALPGTPYLYNGFNGIYKNKLFVRLFGGIRTGSPLRDGVLTDPFRNRTQRPEHQFALPVGVLNP